jgi:hypothetical protein
MLEASLPAPRVSGSGVAAEDGDQPGRAAGVSGVPPGECVEDVAKKLNHDQLDIADCDIKSLFSSMA